MAKGSVFDLVTPPPVCGMEMLGWHPTYSALSETDEEGALSVVFALKGHLWVLVSQIPHF